MDFTGTLEGLPDPEQDRQFYEGVPSRRLAAWVFDVIIVLAIGLPVALLFGIVTFGLGFAAFPFVLGTVAFLYRLSTVTNSSATLGMRFMGIEFRRHDGTRFDFNTALLHSGLHIVTFLFFILQIVSCVAILGTRYGQSVPDILTRSTAINKPAD